MTRRIYKKQLALAGAIAFTASFLWSVLPLHF
jgi:hypothetical protein